MQLTMVWPDDARIWAALLPDLHNAGFRTIAPFLSGFGPTRCRSAETPRCGSARAALSGGWGHQDPDQSLSLRQAQNCWYHWLMAVERGACARTGIASPAICGRSGFAPIPRPRKARSTCSRGPYRRAFRDGLGHFPQRERPDLVLAELLPFLASAAG